MLYINLFEMRGPKSLVIASCRITKRHVHLVCRRGFSGVANPAGRLRIGYVPEHFSTPIYYAKQYFGLAADLIPFPSGTGHMIESLKSSKIDAGIGLTEAWVAGLAKGSENAGYQIVGSYVKSPLCWAFSTGAKRDINQVDQLKGLKIGVSRIGSGSYIMSFVLADQLGWLSKTGGHPFEFIPLSTFKGLRDGVNNHTADAFMWEHFTSKRYYDSGEIKRIGEIYTPWESWKIVTRNPEDKRVEGMIESLNKAIRYFRANKAESISYISGNLDYTAEDARAWLETVEFVDDTSAVDRRDIQKTIDVLDKAGLLDASVVSVDMMIADRSRC